MGWDLVTQLAALCSLPLHYNKWKYVKLNCQSLPAADNTLEITCTFAKFSDECDFETLLPTKAWHNISKLHPFPVSLIVLAW